ncbi:MAG: hypothetical protein KY443_02475 [Actinobacteria bacterium]|nr:hypothetical protein [Actinomycetota bacterium]
MTYRRLGAAASWGAVCALMLPAAVGADSVGPLPVECKPDPVTVVGTGCLPALFDPVTDPGITYPNLVPDVRQVLIQVPLTFDPETGTLFEGPPTLFFDTWAQNLGTVPLQLTANEVNDPESVAVSQCVSWTATRVCRGTQSAGDLTWHQAHRHFHFTEFASYELRRLGPDGRPDYSDAGLVSMSDKVSFCMEDSKRVNPDALPAPFYKACSPALQGVSPGWTDIYPPGVPGQNLALIGVTDGRYALIIDMDYANRLYEADDGDNLLEATIEISNNLTEVAVVDREYPRPGDCSQGAAVVTSPDGAKKKPKRCKQT